MLVLWDCLGVLASSWGAPNLCQMLAPLHVPHSIALHSLRPRDKRALNLPLVALLPLLLCPAQRSSSPSWLLPSSWHLHLAPQPPLPSLSPALQPPLLPSLLFSLKTKLPPPWLQLPLWHSHQIKLMYSRGVSCSALPLSPPFLFHPSFSLTLSLSLSPTTTPLAPDPHLWGSPKGAALLRHWRALPHRPSLHLQPRQPWGAKVLAH